MALSLPHNFAFSCLPRDYWSPSMSLTDYKGTQKEGCNCGEVIRLLHYFINCASAPSLHRESTDSLMIGEIQDKPVGYFAWRYIIC